MTFCRLAPVLSANPMRLNLARLYLKKSLLSSLGMAARFSANMP